MGQSMCQVTQSLLTLQTKVLGRLVDALQGTMEGVPLHIHAMKEPDYVMMLMLTYGTMVECLVAVLLFCFFSMMIWGLFFLYGWFLRLAAVSIRHARALVGGFPARDHTLTPHKNNGGERAPL